MTDLPEDAEWRAVIDIGSNSVRLVIYDVSGKALLPHYNERVMAGLGQGLAETGCLSAEGTDKAIRALGRFRAILSGLSVRHVRAVATAAVRVARDGPHFLARASEVLEVPVQAISGEEEAYLSAVGVASGVHRAEGLVGDLGGSSLEFACLKNGAVLSGETHMLGPLAMMRADESPEKLRKRVHKLLRSSRLLPECGGRFYMVGGAWRALAKLHMDLVGYPLGQLQAYRMDRHAVALTTEASQSTDAFVRQRLAKASQKRLRVLPYAGIVLGELFAIGGFEEAVVSSHGLREGVILEGLASETGSRDALLDGILLYLRQARPRQVFGQTLFEWLQPVIQAPEDLFGDVTLEERIVAATCLLADSGARFHPDHRADMAYDQALRGPFAGVTHQERSFIALAIGCRYARSFEPRGHMLPLLAKGHMRLARQLGAIMRLGAVYSGRSATVLQTSRLSIEEGALVLAVNSADRAMVSNAVERRLAVAADLLGLVPQTRTI